MRMARRLLVFGLVLVLTPILHAQERDPGNERYRVTTLDNQRFMLHHAWLDQSGVTGRRLDGRHMTVPRDSLLSIEQRRGSYIKTGLMIGAATGLLAAFVWYVTDGSEPGQDHGGSKVAGTVLGYTAAGSAIGLAVGVLTPKWEMVDMLSVGLELHPAGRGAVLALRF